MCLNIFYILIKKDKIIILEHTVKNGKFFTSFFQIFLLKFKKKIIKKNVL